MHTVCMETNRPLASKVYIWKGYTGLRPGIYRVVIYKYTYLVQVWVYHWLKKPNSQQILVGQVDQAFMITS